MILFGEASLRQVLSNYTPTLSRSTPAIAKPLLNGYSPVMKRYFALFLAVWFSAVLAHADSIEDQYVQAFNLIQQADGLSGTDAKQATAKYLEAQSALQKIQKADPGWNPSVVSFRLEYVAGKMASLAAKTPAPQPNIGVTNNPASLPPASLETPVPPLTNKTAAPESVPEPKPTTETVPAPKPVTPEPVPPPKPAAPEDWEAQMNSLREQVHDLQSDKSNLEAKLKEAFAMQPATADSAEVARLNEKLKDSQKENDLLKASIQGKTPVTSAASPQVQNQSQAALTEANRQLAEQKDLVARLSLEKEALQSRMRAMGSSDNQLSALRAENEMLKKQVTQLQTASGLAGTPEETARQLALAQTQLAAMQSERDLLRTQKATLEEQLKAAGIVTSGSAVVAADSKSDSKRVKELERERKELQKKLDEANKALYGRKGKALNARVEDLQRQLDMARARMDAFEARAIPFTTEELSLMKEPEPKMAKVESQPGRKAFSELTPTSAKLVADAHRYYATGQYDEAEAAYLQVLKSDEKSVPVLADLASIELRGGHLDSAETNITQALAIGPDNAYSLSVLGRLRFRQNRFDESLDALSRAVKLEPENAEFQNFLGLVLSHKGMRAPAEAAFRKAIQIEPRFANAHGNLAMVYLSGQPPALELARYHYKMALEYGAPHDPEIEKMMDQRSASVTTPQGAPRRRVP
jgi:tetratricopeptide (TPR) repeat protein